MKKIISTICCFLMLMTFSFVAVGCGEIDEKFYQKTDAVFKEYISYFENVDVVNGLDHGDDYNDILAKIYTYDNTHVYYSSFDLYTEVSNVYDVLFINSYKFLKPFENTFIAIESPTNDALEDFKDFENVVKKTLEQLKNFNAKTQVLNTGIQNTNIDDTGAFHIISVQYLKNYKREYLNLIDSIVNVSNKFLNLATKYYYNSETLSLVNQKNIAILKSSVNTITPTIDFFNLFNGDFYKFASNIPSYQNLLDTINNYSNLTIDNNIVSTTPTLLNFQRNYELYTQFLKNFNESVENVNFESYMYTNNFNKTTFYNENKLNKLYIENIEYFAKEAASALYNATELLTI